MKKSRLSLVSWSVVVGLAVIALGSLGWASTKETTLHLDYLTLKGRTYTNVTVTTRTTNYIFIVHAGGMESIKYADIPRDLRRTLGFVTEPAQKTNSFAGNLDLSRLNPFSKPSLNQTNAAAPTTNAVAAPPVGLAEWEPTMIRDWRLKYLPRPESISSRAILAGAAVGFLFYLFFCYCCHLICVKAGTNPGIMVWLPVLQMFPLLRAAGMSPWWFLCYFIPLLNVVVAIVWCFMIVKALGHNLFLAILLLLPLVSLPAFLYLAFAKSAVKPGAPQPAKP